MVIGNLNINSISNKFDKSKLITQGKTDILVILSEEFSTFFEDAVRSLNVEPDEYFLSDTENLSNPVDIAIRKFENDPSVQAIKQHFL